MPRSLVVWKVCAMRCEGVVVGAVPRVGHGHAHAGVLGGDGDPRVRVASGGVALHRLDRVHHEVEDRLVELDRVAGDERHGGGAIEVRLDVRVPQPRRA